MNGLMRQTGRTTRMLLEAISMLPNASMHPILIYGYNMQDAEGLKRRFLDLALERGHNLTKHHRLWAIFNNDEKVEFRSFDKEDSPPGQDYSHIFIDHYAKEVASQNWIRKTQSDKDERTPPSPPFITEFDLVTRAFSKRSNDNPHPPGAVKEREE